MGHVRFATGLGRLRLTLALSGVVLALLNSGAAPAAVAARPSPPDIAPRGGAAAQRVNLQPVLVAHGQGQDRTVLTAQAQAARAHGRARPAAGQRTGGLPAHFPRGKAAHERTAAEAIHATAAPRAASVLNADHPAISSSGTPSAAPSFSTSPKLFVGGNIDGLSIANDGAFGQNLTPPDDCIGFNGTSNYGVQAVNLVVGGFDAGGVGAFLDLNDFFLDGEFQSDPSCFYDALTGNWVFTDLAIDTVGQAESHLNIEIVFDQGAGNKTNFFSLPFAIYRVDTTNPGNPNCPCFGDQPFMAVTAGAGGTLWISTNEFGPIPAVLAGDGFFNGANTYWVSNLYTAPVVNAYFDWSGTNIPDVCFPGGDSGPMSALRPTQAAAPDGNLRELFLTAWDPRECGGNVIVGVAIDETNGSFSTAFSQGQNFFVPPSAQQMGSINLLQNDDDRLERVSMDGNGLVYTSLTSALNLGEAINRSGEEGWKLQPAWAGNTLTGLNILSQNAVGISVGGVGQYMMYFAMGVPGAGPLIDESVGTVSGSAFFPSSVGVEGLVSPGCLCFVVLAGGVMPYGDLIPGSCLTGQCRWGDYTAVATVPGSPGIWFGTEYVSGASFGGTNWATRVTQIQL